VHLRPDERRIAGLTLLLLAAVIAVALGLPHLPRQGGATLLNALNSAVCLVGTVLAAWRARREPEEAIGWWCLAAAGVLQLLYQGHPVGVYLATGTLPPFPNATELLQPPTLLAIGAGLLAWSTQRRSAAVRLRTGVDGFLFGASLLFVIWAVALHDLVVHGTLTKSEQSLVVTDFALIAAILGLIVYLAASVGARATGTLTFIGAALLAGTTSNLSVMVLSLRGDYYVGHPSDALVLLTVGLFTLAALAPGRVVPALAPQPPRRTPAATLLPYVPVLASLFTAALLLGRPDAQGDRTLTMLGVTIGIALLLRQQLTLRDVEELSHNLTETVAARTRDLAQAQAALGRAQRLEAVGRMAGGVARDFDRLIRELDDPVAVLGAAVPQDHPDREAIDEIGAASQRARRLTGQLLTFAQRQPVEPRRVDVSALLADFLPLLRQMAGKAIALELTTPPGAATVFADPTQLEQLLSNLTVNARDAMPDGGTLRIAVSLPGRDSQPDSGGPTGSRVRISVHDTGAGMDEETMGHIFEPFFTTKPAGKGTGLGLATCYGIVSRAGGWIRVQSAPGEGTTFTVDLPRAP